MFLFPLQNLARKGLTRMCPERDGGNPPGDSLNNISLNDNMDHYGDVIMGTMASQITSLTTVYSTVYSGADQRKTSKLRVTGLCAGNSPGIGEFPAFMASNAENVSICWRHHDFDKIPTAFYTFRSYLW